MAEKKRRVHDLAKELQVESKAVIEKCRAEGIEVKNHMHVLSAGLEATIREWFSEGTHSTTLEEASRVDLGIVRVKKTRKKQEEGPEGGAVATVEAPVETRAPTTKPAPPARQRPEAEAGDAAAVTMPLPPAEAEVTAAPIPGESVVLPEPLVPADATPAAPAANLAAEAPVVEAPPAELPISIEPPVEPPTAAPGAPPEPPGPSRPLVAGPQNIPVPAKLTGPKVVRFDRPEYVDRPRPARPGPRPPAGSTAPPTESEEAARRGRGRPAARGKTAAEEAGTAKRVHPRRGPRDVQEVVNERLREWRDRDLIERRERLDQASGRGIGGLRAIEGKQASRRAGARQAAPTAKKDRVEMSEPIIIKDLSRETGIAWVDIQKRLAQEGILANINTAIEGDKAQLIAADYGIELVVAKAKSRVEQLAEEFAVLERKRLERRPPVVTVLGHVDHGKTSLLDRIRQTSVAKGEAGGITQHIGAYRVGVGDKWVTFLDTPGHAAFTAMRARGAHLTDVVVLVVAADDGVMPTTIEAINHARAANTTIVVALNKIDLPHDINKIYGQLSEHGLTPAGDWGGNTDVMKTSAISGEGIQALLEHLATLSDLMELTADPTVPASGTVVEAERSGAKGCLARVLVQEGTLKTGDIVVCGSGYGRVRSLRDDRGKLVKKAGPATPVEVTGLNDVPGAGDRFFVVEDMRQAKEIAEDTARRIRDRDLIRVTKPTSLESVLASASEGEIPELYVVIRADVQGSVDVLKKALSDLPSDQVKLNILHAGVGTVTESDVVLAQASRAIIVGFHVVPDPSVTRMAEEAGVDIRTYRVIYNLLDDIRKALEGLLAPEEKIELRGRAEVREVFNITRVGKVAGCIVRDGVISRKHVLRVLRDSVVVKDNGLLDSLRHFKDDVKEVKNGLECGIRITDFNDLKPGDVIEAYERTEVAKTLD